MTIEDIQAYLALRKANLDERLELAREQGNSTDRVELLARKIEVLELQIWLSESL